MWNIISKETLGSYNKIRAVKADCPCVGLRGKGNLCFAEAVAEEASYGHDGFLREQQIKNFLKRIDEHTSNDGLEIPRTHSVTIYVGD